MRVLVTSRLALVFLLLLGVTACEGRAEAPADPVAGAEGGHAAATLPPEQAARRPAARPDDPVLTPGLPPGASSKVLEIRFPVESLAGRIEGLAVKETGSEMRLLLAADVLFEFDKADLRPDADAALAQAADLIRARGVSAVRVEGHTDGKGTPAYNQRLSERRAEAVRVSLSSRGLSRVRFHVVGLGATRPVAPNTRPDGTDDPGARARNRRVEVVMSTVP